MGARRTVRISERDLEVLELVARYGVIPREVVALWAGTGRAVTAARERRLREAGLIEVRPGVGGTGRLVICKRNGLRAVGREELSVPQLSFATARHSSISARVGALLERAGHRVLSEREIEASERAEGRRVFSAPLGAGSFHRPDLVVLDEERSTAVEVELTDKSARRLDQLLRAWRRALALGQFHRVSYLCSPRALPYVERAIQRTLTGGAVDARLLQESDPDAYGERRQADAERREALRRLPVKQRTVLDLLAAGYSWREICELHGWSYGSVLRRPSRRLPTGTAHPRRALELGPALAAGATPPQRRVRVDRL